MKVGDLIGIGWNGKQPYTAVIQKVHRHGYTIYIIATGRSTYIDDTHVKEAPQ